jgi:hypothetical protein
MPLKDHFHPPLSVRRHWHAFHNAWATFIASELNRKLPDGYFAEPNVQFGIEIDVAAFDERMSDASVTALHDQQVSSSSWRPSPPALTIPLPVVTDIVEVSVYETEGGPVLAGAIELVSPANKDRPEHCDAFVAKCSSYLQQAVGVIIVDIVTSRTGSLHNLLLLQFGAGREMPENANLYASAYRTVERRGETNLDIWRDVLDIDRPLPTMPLWLRGSICLPVELEASYQRTCSEQRLDGSSDHE